MIDDNTVMVFSKSYCPHCSDTKSTLETMGVKAQIIELDVVSGGDALHEELKKVCG